jgi:hypothetical protein
MLAHKINILFSYDLFAVSSIGEMGVARFFLSLQLGVGISLIKKKLQIVMV